MLKPKINIIRLEGIIFECLPSNKYRVKLKTGKIIVAYLCGNMIKNHIGLMKDDNVIIEFNYMDFNKGRIVFRK